MMKRRFDNNTSGGKKQRHDHTNELKFLIHHKAAGAVIGKGGENIKRMRDKFNDIHISIPDSNSPERVLVIEGSIEDEQMIEIVRDLLQRLDEVNQTRLGAEDSELRMLVHASLAGAVIGRAGFKIKELREQTKAELKVYSERCPYSTERVIRINGQTDDVIGCVDKILKICIESPIKGEWLPYDSDNFDPSFMEEYGGYPPDKTWKGPPGGASRFGMGGGAGGPPFGMGGGPPGMPRGMGGAPMMGPPRMQGGPMGGYGGPQRGMGGPPMGGPRAQAPMGSGAAGGGGPVQTTQVTIPNDLAGTIIGKGGERIARIRAEAGAHIAIDTETSGNDERIITISGSPNQIQLAQFLLQQCVRSSSAGRQYVQDQLGMQA